MPRLLRGVGHADRVVFDADDIALGAIAVGVVVGITGLGITALGAGTVDILEDVLAVDLRPALSLAEGDVDGGLTVRGGRVGGAAPEERVVGGAVLDLDLGQLEERIDGGRVGGVR